MGWFLTVVLIILGINVFAILLIGCILMNDWLKDRRRATKRRLEQGADEVPDTTSDRDEMP